MRNCYIITCGSLWSIVTFIYSKVPLTSESRCTIFIITYTVLEIHITTVAIVKKTAEDVVMFKTPEVLKSKDNS